MNTITLQDLTTGTTDGTGVFDGLMSAVESHVQQEYGKNRIRGPEYSTVYLGAMQTVLDQSVRFLLEGRRAELEAQLMEHRIANTIKEGLLLDKQVTKLDAEILLVQAQTDKANAEAANIPKQGALLDAQAAQTLKQTLLIEEQIESEKKNNMLDGLIDKQICKLNAEFDLLMEQKLKVLAETGVLEQKKITEQAQTSGTGVDTDSVVGKQKLLYKAQTDGFKRDAEQKAAKLLADTWSVRRTTDEATPVGVDNKLDDNHIGQAIGKMLSGVGV